MAGAASKDEQPDTGHGFWGELRHITFRADVRYGLVPHWRYHVPGAAACAVVESGAPVAACAVLECGAPVADFAADPDVLDVVRIAFVLCAAVGDDEQSDTCREFWSAITDIVFEGNAREMEADQRELDANVIGQEVDAIVNVLKSVDEYVVTALRRAVVENGAASADWTLPFVIPVFELVYDAIYDLSFAYKAVALGNLTFVPAVVASILIAILVLVKNTKPEEMLVKRVMMTLRYYLEVVERLAKRLWNQRNSGNRERECPKQEKWEKQQEKENTERKKREEQRITDCLKRMKREAKYNNLVRLQNLLDTMIKMNPIIKRYSEPTLTFASWNVRTLNSREYSEVRKTERLCNMLRTLDVDIAALQETRWLESGNVDEEHYSFSWKGKEEKQMHGVGFAVKKELKDQIEYVGNGTERLQVRRIQTTDGPVILISAYAPTEMSTSEDKDQFYEQLGDLMNTIPPDEHVILMGDFNAMVGADNVAWKDIIGPHGVEAKTNNNGTRLLEFCQKFKLSITNTFFEPTFTHKRLVSNTWVQLDFVITRQSFRHKVVWSRSCDCASYDTDHNIVACKVKLKLKEQHDIEPELHLKPKKPDVDDVKRGGEGIWKPLGWPLSKT